jgi:hypothetical protein
VSKKQFLEQIEVKNPCSEDWEQMTGNSQVRFCSHCNLNVNNLSAMTRREALKIVRKSEGRICVRYVQNPVDKTPVFADRLYQITRRAGIAAGVLGASLTLSTLTFAQGAPRLIKRETDRQTEILQINQSEIDKTEMPSTSLSGTITDSNGAFAANVMVILLKRESNEKRLANTNNAGLYEFKNLSAGAYSLIVSGEKGSAEISHLEITEAAENRQDLALSVQMLAEITVQMSEETMFQTISGGIGISISYRSSLSLAVSNDDVEEVRNLIAGGANVNGKEEDSENITPLFLAVENGNAEIAEILLNFGAKINARDKNKQTPLMRLDEDPSPELVRLLIKHGAKVNAADKDGNTPLILAAKNASAEILQILIDHGAEINAQNKEGQTALMNAAYEDNLERVKILILAGADVNLKNKEDESAWDLTTDDDVEKLLELHGAKVKGKDDETEEEDN